MTAQFQSVKNLFKDFIINIFAGLAGGGLLSVLSKSLWMGVLLFAAIATCAIGYLLSSKYKRLFRLIRAGATGYYYSFDLGESETVFRETNDSFCYLGISANSILEFFRKWLNDNPSLPSYSFLLMNPDSPELHRQIAFEKGISLDTDLSSIDSRTMKIIAEEAAVEQSRIRSAIELIKNLPPYLDGKLHIRLYDQFTPWWMYIIDNKKIYLGILEQGKRGQDSPVMTMAMVPGYTAPFDPFKNSWDNLWAEATEV